MCGRQRRVWLEANVPAPSVSGNGEKQQVQALIDGHFGMLETVAFNECIHTACHNGETQSAIDHLIEHETAEHGLAEFVAREKSVRLKEQRSAIRRLGRSRLVALIHRVFDAVMTGYIDDHTIAAEFGLSPATFSRFAGSHWTPGDGRSVPDLWRNTATVVACIPSFRDSAKAAGLWRRVQFAVDGNPGRGASDA
jgi:hypothetical protein